MNGIFFGTHVPSPKSHDQFTAPCVKAVKATCFPSTLWNISADNGNVGLEFGMGDIYDDEFTFYLVGAYKHDVKEDGDLSEGSYLNMSATVVMVSSMTTAKTMVYALPPIRRKPELLSRTTKRKTLAT